MQNNDLGYATNGVVAFDPMLYEAPRGWKIIGYRHTTSVLSPWVYVPGWGPKEVSRHRIFGGPTAQRRIPKTLTFQLLVPEKSDVV